MMNNFNLNFVTLFGIGNIKFAPGTFTSAIVCFVFYFIMIYVPYSFWLILIIFFLILIYAPIAINKTLKNFSNDSVEQMVNQENFSEDDPKQIVIDEVLGMFIPLLAISLAYQMPNLPEILKNVTSTVWFSDEVMLTQLYSIFYLKYIIFIYFLLFRLFDIFKPFPIGYVDRNFKNTFGIIFDDILAGIYCILFAYFITLLSFFIKLIGP